METALVLSTGFRLQYRTLQCCAPLFRAVHVYGTPQARHLAHSRHCTLFHERPAEGPSAFGGREDVAAVRAIVAANRIDYLIPSDAETTRFLGANRTAFAVKCYPVPNVAAFDQLDDKWRFSRLCARLGIPHPQTVLCADTDAVRAALGGSAPGTAFVIKPLALWGSSGVRKIDAANAEDILRDTTYAPLLLQAFVPGPEFTTAVLCRSGRVKRAVHYRRDGSSVVFFEQPEATRLAEAIAAGLRLDGVMVFDIKTGPGGQLFVLECNPRFWYRMDAAFRAGANFVELGLWPRRFKRQRRSPITPQRLAGLREAVSHRLRHSSTSEADDALVAAVLSDPAPYMLMAASRFQPSRRAAGGQQL